MKPKVRINIFKSVIKLFNSNVFYYSIIIVLILILYKNLYLHEVELKSLFDLTLIISLFITLVATRISMSLTKIFKRKLEDPEKLTIDYKELIGRYEKSIGHMFVHQNQTHRKYKSGRRCSSCDPLDKKGSCDAYIIPAILGTGLVNKKLIIHDKQNLYRLPEEVRQRRGEIMKAHMYSKVYNQLCIRVDDALVSGEELLLYTSRTHYFDSLVTNRAMDYEWEPKLTNRELLNPGPYFESLKESQLSNHLGWNAFLETLDGDIIFEVRGKKVSVAKNSLGSTIGISVKTKIALDDCRDFSLQGLIQNIKFELAQNFCLEEEDYQSDLETSFVAFYRDMVEGGKPQLLSYIKLNKTTDELFQKNATGSCKLKNSIFAGKCSVLKTKSKKKKFMFVGNEIVKQAYISPDSLILGNRIHRTVPSAAISLSLVLEHMGG